MSASEKESVSFKCLKCGRQITLNKTWWETIQKMDFSIMEGMLIDNQLCRDCYEMKKKEETFTDFEEQRAELKLIVCPKCAKAMKVFVDEHGLWKEFWICEECKIGLDASR